MSQLPATPPTGGASVCWNCQQPLQAGSARCLWCGVSQQAAPTQFVVAPGPLTPGIAPAVAPPAQPQSPQAQAAAVRQVPVAPRAPRGAVPIGPGFSGSVAGTGARLVSFTIDVIVVLVITAVVTVLTRSALYGSLAFGELVVGLLVIEARTGLTVGNALLRLRASRLDLPYSPGIGRSFVRWIVTGAGFLVLGLGAWVIVASSAWDSSRRGRSWADLAGGTLVVTVPRRTRTVATAGVALAGAVPTAPASAPTAYPIPVEAVVLAAPQVISTAARGTAIDEESASSSHTGVPVAGFAPTPVPIIDQQDPIARMEPPSTNAEGSDGTLLLIFDTGQREQFGTPVVINLGRNPVATEPGDKLIVVNDPESTVSKTHLRLEHSRGRTWVTDGGSTNGTELLSDDEDVVRLTAGERVLVDEGVRVRVGNRAFTISLLLGGEKA